MYHISVYNDMRPVLYIITYICIGMHIYACHARKEEKLRLMLRKSSQ